MINNILINLLLIKTKITSKYNYVKSIFTDTESILIIKNNKPYSVWFRYCFIVFLNYIINLLKNLKYKIDITTDTIQIIKNNGQNRKVIILDSNLESFNRNIGINDLIKYINNNKLQSNYNKPIINKFNLIKNDSSLCLKKYISQYDNNKNFAHTLDNIIKFNNIEDNYEFIEIIFYKNMNKSILKLNYDEVKYKHIDYLFNINQ